MLVYPDYFTKFKCVAGACTHSCCIGWEIDVDEDALARYRSMKGEIGQRLQEKIDWEAEPPHFILDDQDRCPFLNGEGLCDLICAGGEEALCQICADHPRFRNFYSDRVEIGLGLCCEAAGRLILETEQPVQLVAEGEPDVDTPDDEECAFFAWRDSLLATAQDRSLSIPERLARLEQAAGVRLDSFPKAWAEVYLKLETLDADWPHQLESLKNLDAPDAFDVSDWAIPLEQLLVYFLYRHLAGALDDGRYRERLAFAVLSVRMLMWLAAAQGIADLPALTEIARRYSAEIEYSEDNLEALLDTIEDAMAEEY